MMCALPSDMSTEGLNMVENIMLAQVREHVDMSEGSRVGLTCVGLDVNDNKQAQACFYEKAVADRMRSTSMKASVIARLAAQVSDRVALQCIVYCLFLSV